MGRKALLHPVGARFGWQEVIGHVRGEDNRTMHVVRCCCGTEKKMHRTFLERNKSCGCKNHIYKAAKHGMSNTRTYRQWRSMKLRCTNKKRLDYPSYGGRGIAFCPEWESFEAFFDDMGECPDGLQLDRIDNDGNYGPENCRWVTPTENANNRRSNREISLDGERKTLIQWARETGIPRDTLAWRLDAGWSASKALSSPVKTQKNNRATVE